MAILRRLAKVSLATRARRRARWTVRLQRASIAARHYRQHFDEVECFTFFHGFERSGTTLVAQLLTAHPDVVIGHELKTFEWIGFGASRDQLFGQLLATDAAFAAGGR